MRHPSLKILCKILVEARRAKKLTQFQLAKELGKPQSFVSKYESGERRLDVVEFVTVCKALSISPSKVLKRIELSHG